MSAVLEAIEGIGKSFDAVKKVNEEQFGDLRSRIENLEAANDRPSKPNGGGFSRDQVEHKDLFCDWLRKPLDGPAKRRLEEAQQEVKAVTVGTPSAGGYAVPTIIASEIEKMVTVLNPFRSLVRVVDVGSRDYKHLLSANEAGSGWVGEGDSRGETVTSRLIERAPTFGTVYAYPKASEESMQDIFFNVQQWLVEEVSDAFAAAEAAAIVSGDGTSKPTGFLNTGPSVIVDWPNSPERSVEALQYLPITAGSSPFTLAGIGGNDLIDLQSAVREQYLADPAACAWVMRRETLAHIRKLKDSYGQYLLQPGLSQGAPPTLLGYPVATTNAMPANSAGNCPIAFGNWRRAYLLCDRVRSMEITVDANITTPGQVKFYVRRVVGGKILNHQAVKVIKYALS